MKRGPLTWIVGIAVGVVLVLGVTALIGNRDKQGETVTAAEWAQNTCGSVGAFRGEMESIVEDIRTPSAVIASGEEPQSETPQGRTGFIRVGMERGVQATKTLVEGVDNAGIPDTAEGEEAARRVSAWADSARERSPGVAGRARQRGGHPRAVDRPGHGIGANDRGGADQRLADARWRR